ncbi:glycosyltransferase family 9 protein [Candidatus Cyanaurora vandensis]|uniref:glycosyltransferase family 9 protein n=1 Tax=Candidatus Cyanaurora vandensis TaxID=2714958 RepID=UPI00257FC4AB|nr:glycosyltransferase family 9 protein [Candidatus Cyanaurora vandensis]
MLRVLALSPGGIGDQILLFPTLAGLKATYADLTVDVLVEPRSQGVYGLCPSVRKAMVFDYKNNPAAAAWVDLIGIIRDRSYDAVLALGRSPGVAFLLWLTGIRKRVGYGYTAVANTLLTHPVPLRQDQYAAQMYYDLLQGFGITTPCPQPTLMLRDADRVWATQQLQANSLNPQQLVLLHPGTSQLSREKGLAKTYPAQKWSMVIADLAQKLPQAQVVIVSGPDDREILEMLQRQLGNVFIMPPDLGKLAALIAEARLLLCVDSAPMHIAVATNRPLVALFGPTDPQRLLPSDARFDHLQSKFVEQIAPSEVVQAVLRQFNPSPVLR